MGGTTKGVTRRRAVAGCIVVVIGASVAAWAVAYPQAVLAATVVRALADCAAAATLGLAAVPMLDAGRHSGELTRNTGVPLAAAAGFWLFAELCRLVVGAIAGLGTRPLAIAASGITAVGLVARTIGGHMSASSLGAVAIAIHALAAALWCGTLAALVLTVDHRGQWARVLPRFSELSLLCVIALLAGGVTGALVALDSPSQLFASGYGRVLLIKIVLTVVLMTLAWRNRARWLPAAKSLRVTAYVSRSRSLTELAIMAVALTMAAALSIAG